MKHLFFYFLVSLSLILSSCSKDENPVAIDYSYHAHIDSPDATDKSLGDTLIIHVEFESHTGETIHYANVRIYNKDNGTELYSKPDDIHVDEESGVFVWEDTLVLSSSNGFSAGSHYVFEAKVWGDNDGDGEVIETVEFHVM